MAASTAAELVKLTHSAVIELFVLDATVLGGTVYRFHAGTNALRSAVIWQGQTYTPWAIEATGFEVASTGPATRPRMRVSNYLGMVGALNRDFGNLEGAKIVRKRTLLRFLDAANFPGAVNPTADAQAGYPDDTWYIDRLAYQDGGIAEYELGSPLDLTGVRIPARQVIARVCGWGYRSPECSYAGGPVADANDVATASLAADQCGHRLSSCRLRFSGRIAQLPFGGFPGAGVLRQV
jgi:lambda family phage minor tail protein L